MDICSISETWLQIDDKDTSKKLPPPGYSILSTPRVGKQGGGVAVLYKDYIKVVRGNDVPTSTMERIQCNVKISNTSINLITI